MKLIIAAFIVVILIDTALAGMNTSERIVSYNYPVETHQVYTSDGYVLTTFRIPYSPKLNNKQQKDKPVVFLQHGLLSSSDCWILNGPDNALPFLLSDAGYDVWLGNNRGNSYSRKHMSMSSSSSDFWNFSWNEMGIYDLPSMIDYVLYHSNQQALHYVGHSQGTTIFFVLMSEQPGYNKKIKTAHMLAPVVYARHMASPFAKIMAPLMNFPSVVNMMMGKFEFLPSNKLISMMASKACDVSVVRLVCENIIFLMAGYSYKHLNTTMVPAIVETHPAGASTTQFLHYLQVFNSGKWRKYDNGFMNNYMTYGQLSPPEYKIGNVKAPVWLYYSDFDNFSAQEDVIQLMGVLPNLVGSFQVPYSKFSHLDFVWANEVKPLLFDRIMKVIEYFEETGKLKKM